MVKLSCMGHRWCNHRLGGKRHHEDQQSAGLDRRYYCGHRGRVRGRLLFESAVQCHHDQRRQF